MQPEDVDHINTHGTSTPLGDVELKAISAVFGIMQKHQYQFYQINDRSFAWCCWSY
jgi:3-oxoacyl-(acyl-carrier-protein) synthase